MCVCVCPLVGSHIKLCETIDAQSDGKSPKEPGKEPMALLLSFSLKPGRKGCNTGAKGRDVTWSQINVETCIKDR